MLEIVMLKEDWIDLLTISFSPNKQNPDGFLGLHRFLDE